MGANCCVAARDKPLPNRLSSEVSNYRNIRHSPSWSFRWDNRTHIDDIMDNPSRVSHCNSGNIGSEGKSTVDAEIERLYAGNSRPVFADQSASSNLSPEKAGHSHGGSSDGWSMRTFSELVAASSHKHPSPKICRVCSKLLKEKYPWSPQMIVSTNELSVTAVLACGHVYHAECLESATLEIDRYDPPCPICTHGENSIPRMMKARSKISRRAVVDIDVDSKWSGRNLSVKKPFLKRHFSIGSQVVLDGEAARKKTGFWGRR